MTVYLPDSLLANMAAFVLVSILNKLFIQSAPILPCLRNIYLLPAKLAMQNRQTLGPPPLRPKARGRVWGGGMQQHGLIRCLRLQSEMHRTAGLFRPDGIDSIPQADAPVPLSFSRFISRIQLLDLVPPFDAFVEVLSTISLSGFTIVELDEFHAHAIGVRLILRWTQAGSLTTALVRTLEVACFQSPALVTRGLPTTFVRR